MAIARPIYSSMISAHTGSDFFGIENHKVSRLFGLVVSFGKFFCLPEGFGYADPVCFSPDYLG
jgi:hypothetical protein